MDVIVETDDSTTADCYCLGCNYSLTMTMTSIIDHYSTKAGIVTWI